MSRQIGEVPTREFKAGEIIIREGDDPKGEAFLVHIGQVEVRKASGQRHKQKLGKAVWEGDGAALYQKASR